MGTVWYAQDATIARLRAQVDHQRIIITKKDECITRLSAELERTLGELGRVSRELAKLRGPLPPVEHAARREPYGDDAMYLGEG